MDLDFSKNGLSASISQNQECKDSVFRERLLCNISRKAPSELAVSSSHRGEISACVLGLSLFRHLLLLAPFKIRSDSISVRYLSTLKDQRAPFPRYFQLLADFTFTAEHRPGKSNIPDDSISRRDDLPEMTREEIDFHSSRSFVEQLTSTAQLEALEDIAIEFADPFPTLWSPQAYHPKEVWACSPQDMVKTDIDTPNIQQRSICPELHPKLQYLNEIQLQFRGKVGGVYTDKYLEEMWSPAPQSRASVSSSGAPVCPSLPAVPPPGVPDSPARLPSAPVAPQAPRPQVPGPGPGPVRPQAPAPGPWPRPRPRPRPLAPGRPQAPAPGRPRPMALALAMASPGHPDPRHPSSGTLASGPLGHPELWQPPGPLL